MANEIADNTKNWARKAIIYQIYPRSFYDANNDGIGDLKGITQKLDYLKELGIDAIWLSPIYKSPMNDMGYDIADYKDIDPLFGTLQDCELLIEEAHNRDLKILMDFVPNHTSSEHEWFKEARKSRDNPKRNYYIWKDPTTDGEVPNNWLSVFGGSAWQFDETTGQYYYHSFDREQPDLNWRNPAVVKEMLDVLRFWLDKGVDGFRVDVPEWMFKDEQFRDEPADKYYETTGIMSAQYHSLRHIYTVALPESTEMVKKFIDVLEEYKNKFMVTEVWSPVEQLIKMYDTVGKDFYAPFNFGLITLPWRADTHKKYIDDFDHAVGSLYLPTYVLSNHDKSRVATRIGRDQARIGAMLLFTLRGIPFVYYGEELGMTDVPISPEKIQDTFEKNSPGLGLNRDPERTPMQWTDETHAGFSEKDPWLPISEDFKTFNVTSETVDPTSYLNLYKKLIAVRKDSKALQFGEYKSLDSSTESVFMYTRSYKDEIFFVFLNYSAELQHLNLQIKLPTVFVCSTYMDSEQKDIELQNITLRPHEGGIFKVASKQK